jgi:hypothetical protein
MLRVSHRLTESFAAWVAIAAVVLNALWPLIFQLQADVANMQMDICSQTNMQHQDAASGPEPEKPSPLIPHCAFCTLAGGGFAALVAARVTPALLSIETEEARLRVPEVRPLAFVSYSPAHPRAPPASFS